MTVHSLERLIADHQRIMALAARLARAIADDQASSAAGLRDAVEVLLDELLPHLGIEDRDIYPRLLIGHDDATTRAAIEAIERFEGTARDWMAYRDHWTVDAIASDRTGFGVATAGLLNQLNARVRSENELLYPLALQSSTIRLRA